MQMVPVIRSAFGLSRRLDLRNAIYVIYELNRPIVVMFAFAIDQGTKSRSKFFYRRDTGASNSLLFFSFYCSTNDIVVWMNN